MSTAQVFSPSASAPAAAQPHPERWLGLLALSVSVLTVIMTATSVNLALPSISAAFNISTSSLSWVLDAYTLALAALTLPGGTLGDIFGRRRVYITGLAVFSCGALLASVAPTIGVLIAARVAMGVGAALVLPGTLALISAMFQGRERATAIGLWGGMNGLGLALGPIVGGVLVEYVNWRAVFWTNVPLVAIAFIMVPRFVPSVAPRQGEHHIDVPGTLSVTASLTALIVALIQGPSWGWTSAGTLGCFGAFALLLACFIAIEARVAQPMIPLRLFRSRTFCAANVSAVVLMLSILSTFFFLSLYLQDALGFSAIRTGIAYLPLALFIAGLAPLAGRLSARFGPRLPLIIGLLSSALGVAWMSRVDAHSGYAGLIGGLVLSGCGLGLASPPISNAAVSSVPAALAGAASGMNAMSRQVGGAVGIALLTSVFAGRFTDHLTRGLAASHLPEPVRRQVLASADTVASGTQPTTGTALTRRIGAVIHTAFVQGMADTLTLFAVIATVGVLAALAIRRSDFVQARSASTVDPAMHRIPASASTAGGMQR